MHVFDRRDRGTEATRSGGPESTLIQCDHDQLAHSQGQGLAERGGKSEATSVECSSTLRDTQIDASDVCTRDSVGGTAGAPSVACSPMFRDAEIDASDVCANGCVPEVHGEGDQHVGGRDRQRGQGCRPSLPGNQSGGITGPKFFPQLERDVEGLEGQQGGNHETMEGSERAGVETAELPTEAVTVKVGSWNLAGASAKEVKSVLTHVLDYDIVGFQEYAKQKDAGWQLLKGDDFHGVVHQNYVMYRPTAIFYRKNKFQLLRKCQMQRGIWIQLQHIESTKVFWIGSCHFPNNEPVEELTRLHREFFTIPRGDADRKIAVGDFNVQFSWIDVERGVEPKVLSSKWARLRQQAADHGLRQATPPAHQLNTPTFVSCKGNVASKQIDGGFVNGDSRWTIRIREDSRHEIGADHDRIDMEFMVRRPREGRRSVSQGGPRVVARPIPPQHDISESSLQQIAKKYTKPLSLGPKFTASAATRECRDLAMQSRTAEHWKAYLSALRKEKQAWKDERLVRAVEDWKTYKQLTKPRKPWGDDYMMRVDTVDPVGDIGGHFAKVFHDPKQMHMQQEMRQLAEGLELHGVRPFTAEEVAESIAEGKRGKATGPDAIPTEMLQHMCADPVSLEALTSFYNSILRTGEVPSSWDKSISTLIPKITPLGGPKDLRPIALASHVSKSFSRMVLKRLDGVLQVTGSQQCAAKSRQPADFVWSTIHVVHLAREWKVNAYLLKLAPSACL